MTRLACDHILSVRPSVSIHSCFRKQFLQTSPPEPLIGFWQLHRNDPWLVLFQSCSNESDPLHVYVTGAKNRFGGGGAESFKNLLINQWTDFNLTWQEFSLVTLYQDWSSCHDLSKNMAFRGRGLFSLYMYIEIFKNLFAQVSDIGPSWSSCSNFRTSMVRSWCESSEYLG